LSDPTPLAVASSLGTFRVLHWGAVSGRAALLLHGLTGVAEVWGPTIDGLGREPRCYAMDQRGHGHSAKPEAGYAIGDYVGDALRVIDALQLAPVDLVGHSMGARVAMVLAARHPDVLRSVAIVDIGPEAWEANHEQTVAAIERMPASFPDL
jgi:pimeloyl-ACP methyl ester carboxylesterase